MSSSQNNNPSSSTTTSEKHIKSKMNFIEKFYWDDNEELERKISEACQPKQEIFKECVKIKSYNRCVIPERRDYQHCLLEEKLKYTENNHNFFQRMALKAEFYRGNKGDTPSDYFEQRFEEDRKIAAGEKLDEDEDD
ncbi:hypothetical protein NAEGRDRAFT_78581 [Naegleria gruberi]|uniref:Uncharacterized protein n=1 Tax=Naegleria gruberi TaxID=5762 RepID=D2V4N6_NAEGR|nr:uncharacterized protein NAEGRDRAFT_78581 [Naegleria gruberi]EFC48135.1 hypothetical protein NAEGRDRAFT_78581 [Naegleria gruberi]|eukprot:XP_002680879.1 hypothetical protein NAEGRDRAFT_78581 [Naegleria gruberi strain NEG-M]